MKFKYNDILIGDEILFVSCIQLPVSMHGGNGKVAYIDTEGTLYPSQNSFVIALQYSWFFSFQSLVWLHSLIV
jgi:Rad51